METEAKMEVVEIRPLRDREGEPLPKDVKAFLIHEDDGKRDEPMVLILRKAA
jgi:hypothetical protein